MYLSVERHQIQSCLCTRLGERDPGVPNDENHRRWIDLQLPLYALLYGNSPNLDACVRLAYFNLPKAVSETGIYVWEDFDADMMGPAMRCAEGVLNDIGDAVFWPPSERVPYDDYDRLLTDDPEKVFDLAGSNIREQQI